MDSVDLSTYFKPFLNVYHLILNILGLHEYGPFNNQHSSLSELTAVMFSQTMKTELQLIHSAVRGIGGGIIDQITLM